MTKLTTTTLVSIVNKVKKRKKKEEEEEENCSRDSTYFKRDDNGKERNGKWAV